MRTAVAEDMPQVSPAIAALSGFIMVCLALLVVEVAYLSRDQGASAASQRVEAQTSWRSLTL
jgi:hypothetical protein